MAAQPSSRRSSFNTLFLTLLLVIVIPLSILLIFFITTATTMVREDYILLNRQSVSNVCDTLDTYLSARLNTAYDLAKNLHVKKLANTSMDISASELIDECLDIKIALHAANVNNHNIFSHSAIYFPDRDLVVGSTNPHMDPIDFYEQYLQLENIDAASFYTYVCQVQYNQFISSMPSHATNGSLGQLIVYIQPINLDYLTPRAYFITLINVRAFSNFILSMFESGMHFIICDASGTPILYSAGIPDSLLITSTGDGAIVKSGSETYYTFYYASVQPALRYMFYIPQSNVLKQLNTFLHLWFVALGICLIIGILLARSIARRVYGPFQTLLYEAFPGGPASDVHSIQAEIALVTDKMRADQHRSCQTETELRTYYESMRTTMLMRLLTSSLNMTQEVLLESVEMADLPSTHAIYQAAMLELSAPCEDEYPLGAYVFPNCTVRTVRFSATQYLFLFMSTTDTFKRDTQVFLDVLSNHPQDVRVGISRPYEDIRMLQRCLSEASAACRHHVHSENPYITYDTLVMEVETIYYPVEKEMQILAAVRSGNWEETNALLTDLHRVNLNSRRLVPAMARLLYNSMIATAMKAYDQLQTESPMLLAENLRALSSLQESREPDQRVFEQILRCYQSLCNASEQANQHKNRQVVDNVLEYLETCYADSSVCLDMVADHLNVSYYFLSRIFKEETTKSFSDMLNDIRIRHAIDLLASTQDTVQDISARVGYTNWSTFLRAFRKRTGTTPLQYRKDLHA